LDANDDDSDDRRENDRACGKNNGDDGVRTRTVDLVGHGRHLGDDGRTRRRRRPEPTIARGER
jgi:hypothetical protein